jgi:hypothetical protein
VHVFPMRPGAFPMGSPQSRAAARLPVGSTRSEMDGAHLSIDGLAERLRAARIRYDAWESPVPVTAIEGGEENNGRGRADCLEERMRRAEERVRRLQAQASS